VALHRPVLPKLSALGIEPVVAWVSQPTDKPLRNLSSRSVLKPCGFGELKQSSVNTYTLLAIQI